MRVLSLLSLVVRPLARQRPLALARVQTQTSARRRVWSRHHRVAALWMLGAFALWQFGLALFVEQPNGLAVRDPEYVQLESLLRERIAEHPERPVEVFVGSSRVAVGFDAERAAQGRDVTMFNFGIAGSGPAFQAIVLDRLAASGIVPDVLYLEVMHPFLNAAGVRSLDYSLLDGARLDAKELESVLNRRSTGPVRRWAMGRAVPASRYQAELRDAVGLDVYQPGEHPPSTIDPSDAFGFRPKAIPESEWPAMTGLAHRQYDPFFAAWRFDERAWGRLRELIAKAKSRGSRVVVVLTPEGSEFHNAYSADCRAGVWNLIERLRGEADVIDARDWLADSAFYDQHHLSPGGATEFAERFRRETSKSVKEHRHFRDDPTDSPRR